MTRRVARMSVRRRPSGQWPRFFRTLDTPEQRRAAAERAQQPADDEPADSGEQTE